MPCKENRNLPTRSESVRSMGGGRIVKEMGHELYVPPGNHPLTH